MTKLFRIGGGPEREGKGLRMTRAGGGGVCGLTARRWKKRPPLSSQPRSQGKGCWWLQTGAQALTKPSLIESTKVALSYRTAGI